MKASMTDMIGWYGVTAILAAYALVSFSVIEPRTFAYVILNLTGSAAVAYEAWRKKDYEPVTLNVIWALIALIGLIRLW